MRRLRILTWHVHGNYMWYLSQAPHDFYLPVKADRSPGYGGRGSTFPFGENVHEVPAAEVRHRTFDCILFQHRRNYEVDQHELLSERQKQLPRIFLEHDPPLEHPTNTVHCVNDPQVLVVHVTPYNALMWDSGRSPVRVIDHGVLIPEGLEYTGRIERGIVVVNHMLRRGRRLGLDIFQRAREEVPLDLVGMGAEELGGLGEIQPPLLPEFERHYRFFFHPIRYTSLGLAVIEAMMLGLPIIGLATTELPTVIQNGVSGYVESDVSKLIAHMHRLLKDAQEASELGNAARRYALERFNIHRFVQEWDAAFLDVTGTSWPRAKSHALTEGMVA